MVYIFLNSEQNFFDFNDFYVSINFSAVMWFLAEQTVCMNVCLGEVLFLSVLVVVVVVSFLRQHLTM